MKMRFVFLFLLASLLCSCGKPKVRLTTITYNMHYGVGMDGRLDLQRFIDFFKEYNPDVIFLQEADTKTVRSTVDQPGEIAKALGMYVYHAPAMDFNGGKYGNAILSKYPLENTQTIILEGGYYTRSAGVAEIVKDGQRIGLICVHLDHQRRDLHIEHCKLIMDAVQKNYTEKPYIPTIWGGDFNANEKSELWQTIGEYWEIPLKEGNPKTSPSNNRRSEIDWLILAPKGSMEVIRYFAIDEPMISDHCPVLMEIEVK